MIERVKQYISQALNKENQQLSKIGKLQRYSQGKFKYGNVFLSFPDAKSFGFTFKEIFQKEIYKFYSANYNPNIIDCGANIGLSIIYFKKLYPNSNITAFEPEKSIHQYLVNNLSKFNFNNLNIINKAIWKEDGEIMFFNEKSDASRIISDSTSIEDSFYLVPCVRLSHYINQKIDFLKIDIEGAELEVLREIQSKLNLIDRIFIEYHSFENRNQELNELLSILSINGFRYFINSSVNTAETPFVKVEKWFGFDLFLNIFAYRL